MDTMEVIAEISEQFKDTHTHRASLQYIKLHRQWAVCVGGRNIFPELLVCVFSPGV